MQSILGANHNYEKSSLSFCFTRRFNFDFLLCKRDLKIKNKFAPGTGKKSRRHSICKTFRSGSAKALRYFYVASIGAAIWLLLRRTLVLQDPAQLFYFTPGR